MSNDSIVKQRRKVESYRGLRKIRAEAELVRLMVQDDNLEALALADDVIRRARDLLQRAGERGKDSSPYEDALAGILSSKAYVLFNSTQEEEALVLLDEAVELLRKGDNFTELVQTYFLRVALLRQISRFSEARAQLEYLIDVARQLGDHAHEAAVLHDMGTLDLALERHEEAEGEFEGALELFRELADTRNEIITMYHLCTLYEHIGRPAKALEQYGQTLELMQRSRDIEAAAVVNHAWNYARMTAATGQTRKAVAILDEWVAVAQKARLEVAEASYREVLADLHLDCAEYLEAYHSTLRSKLLYERIQSLDGVAMCLAKIGSIFASIGLDGIADTYFDDARDLFAQTDNSSRSPGVTPLCIGILTMAMHNRSLPRPAHYLKFLRSLAADFPHRSDNRRYFLLQQCLAVLEAHEGQAQSACALLGAALERTLKIKHVQYQCDIRLRLGGILAVNGDADTAVEQLLEALELARSSGRTDTERHVHRRLEQLYEERGAAEKAQEQRRSGQALRDQTIRPQMQQELERLHGEAESEQRKEELQLLRDRLRTAEENNAALQRLLDTKTAHTTHLMTVLNRVANSLRQSTLANDSIVRRALGEIEAAAGDDSWQEFEEEAREQDDDFMLRLSRDFPALTSAERRVCALIRVNTTTKDLSRMLNVSPRTIQAYRYRIRKKLKLPPEADLNAYILGL